MIGAMQAAFSHPRHIRRTADCRRPFSATTNWLRRVNHRRGRGRRGISWTRIGRPRGHIRRAGGSRRHIARRRGHVRRAGAGGGRISRCRAHGRGCGCRVVGGGCHLWRRVRRNGASGQPQESCRDQVNEAHGTIPSCLDVTIELVPAPQTGRLGIYPDHSPNTGLHGRECRLSLDWQASGTPPRYSNALSERKVPWLLPSVRNADCPSFRRAETVMQIGAAAARQIETHTDAPDRLTGRSGGWLA
jgi:hypothetical protein